MTLDHPLFQAHPIRGTAQISTGDVPVPYHIYDGYGVLIGGTADLAAVRQLLMGEAVKPINNDDGRALMGLWLCDFRQASLGPHHELQISFFVSRGESAPIAAKRVALLAAMLARPDIQMMCHGLWNNTPTVVTYNRELLSLNARLSRSEITRNSELLTATVADVASGQSLLKATLIKPDHASPRASMGLLSQLGFARDADQPPAVDRNADYQSAWDQVGSQWYGNGLYKQCD